MQNLIIVKDNLYFEDLATEVSEALLSDVPVIILDFGEVDVLTSSVIGLLLSVVERVKGSGSRLKIMNFTRDFFNQLDELKLLHKLGAIAIDLRQESNEYHSR